jgi:uncharacterized protein YjbJ (UPF0337 family)
MRITLLSLFYKGVRYMNKDIIQGKWKEIKGNIKQHWGRLTDDEIANLNGSYEELEGLLQKKYGYEKDRTEQEIDSFLDKYRYKEETEV